MTLKESIKKVLSEETLKDSLTDIIKTDGIERAAKTVGGLTRLAKILELDLDDVDTQEMLVKNFIYHTKFDQIDVSFIEVRSSNNGGKILDVHFKTGHMASNVTSWYVNEICDYLNKELFPFKVRPAWHPVFALSGCKIFLDAEVVDEDDEEDLLESKKKGPRELPNELIRRVQRLDDLIVKVIKDIELCKYNTPDEFIYVVLDELLWELRDEYHGDLNKLDKFDVTHYVNDFKHHELEDYYLENCHNITDKELTEYARTLKNARQQGVGLRFPKSAIKANPSRFRPYNR